MSDVLTNAGDSVDFKIKRGATFEYAFQVTEDDDVTPIDITGRTYTATCKVNGEVVEQFSCTITDGPNGWGLVKLTPEQTAELPLGNVVRIDMYESYDDVVNPILEDCKALVKI